MVANYASMDIKPGSMGWPLPGVEAAIVRRLPDGGVERVDEPHREHDLHAIHLGGNQLLAGKNPTPGAPSEPYLREQHDGRLLME